MRTIGPLSPFALCMLASAACGSGASSSPSDAGSGTDGASGGDGPAHFDPAGDPPRCAAPGAASMNPPPDGSVSGVLDVTGTKFVVFGGDTAVPVCGPPGGHAFIADTYLLDVGCGTWTKTAGTGPSPRGRQAMALDATSNRAILFGGRYKDATSAPYTTYADVWTFDFATNSWTQLPARQGAPHPIGRANSSAVVDAGAGRLVVFGGNTSTDGTTLAPQSDTWAFDLATSTWTVIASSGARPPAREYQAMALDANMHVAYVYGGGDANAFVGPFLKDVWALDLTNDSWSQVATTGTGPGGRIEGALVFDAVTKQLLAFGGHDDGAIGNENDLFALDLSTSPARWAKLPPGDSPGAPATGACSFPPNFTNIDMQAPERRSAFAYGPRVDGHAFVVFGGGGDCGLLSDSWWWSNGSGRWTSVQATPVGLSCLRIQTSCKGLCG